VQAISKITSAFISVVVTAREFGVAERNWLQMLHASLSDSLTDYEVILITSDAIGLKAQDVSSILSSLNCVRVIVLTHPVNEDVAILAGLESAIGDYIVSVPLRWHSTGQVFETVALACSGADVVFGISKAPHGPIFQMLFRLVDAVGPPRGAGRLAPANLNRLFCLNRQSLNQLLAAGRLQHGLFDRMAKVAGTLATVEAASDGARRVHHLSRREMVRSVLLPLMMDSTRLVRRVTLMSVFCFALARVLSSINWPSVWFWALLDVAAWSGLLVVSWFIAEYAYRSLEKDGQMHPYIIREELQSRVMNPMLKTNVVS